MSNVTTTHNDYSAALKTWTTMEDVLDSQQRIFDKGEVYLPKLTDQTEDQYESYKTRGSFPLFTQHVLTTFVGMALRKDLLLENVPIQLIKNVDGAGTTLTSYTKELLNEFLSYRRCLTLIEYATKNKRPKLLLYNHLSIINWKTRVINEKEQLSLIVLKEMVDVSDDEFITNLQPQYRVLSLDKGTNYYRQRVFKADGKEDVSKNIVPKKNRKPLQFIPAVMHGGTEIKKPPLLSIAEQNLSWYRLDCDHKHGLHYVALPTPGTIGVDPDKNPNCPTSIGPTKLWYLPEGASAFMLEFSGAGLKSISDAKSEINENIITLSSRILSPPRNMNETATAASIRNAGETASLADSVNLLSREITQVLEMAINWDNVVDNISALINTDFIPTILSGGDAASYGAMLLKNTLSSRSLFKVLKQGELIEGDRTYEEDQADINKEKKEQDDRDVNLAGRIADREAEAQIKVQNNAALHIKTGSDSEPGKTNGDEANLQGKQKEQSNKKQNQKEN